MRKESGRAAPLTLRDLHDYDVVEGTNFRSRDEVMLALCPSSEVKNRRHIFKD